MLSPCSILLLSFWHFVLSYYSMIAPDRLKQDFIEIKKLALLQYYLYMNGKIIVFCLIPRMA